MTKDEAMKMALEALKWSKPHEDAVISHCEAITAIEEALAQLERHELQAKDKHPAPCARHCEANAFKIVIKNLKAQLAQPEQEPVAHCKVRPLRGDESFPKVEIDWVNQPIPGPLYTTPPQRKPLSNQKIIEMYNEPRSDAEMIEFARAIEAAHGIWPENSDCYGPDWTDRDGEYLK